MVTSSFLFRSKQRKCAILYLIKRTLESFNVFLTETDEKVAGSCRIRDSFGPQYPQQSFCFLQSFDVVDNFTAGEEVVHKVQNIIGFKVRIVAPQY